MFLTIIVALFLRRERDKTNMAAFSDVADMGVHHILVW